MKFEFEMPADVLGFIVAIVSCLVILLAITHCEMEKQKLTIGVDGAEKTVQHP